MPYAHSHFEPIAELPSEYGLTIWGYGTQREPGSVDAPGFFQTFQHHLKVGDLLLVRHTGKLTGPDVVERPAPVLALYGIDRDARGTVVLHQIWRFAWADARAAAAAARRDAAAGDVAKDDAGTGTAGADAARADAKVAPAGAAGKSRGPTARPRARSAVPRRGGRARLAVAAVRHRGAKPARALRLGVAAGPWRLGRGEKKRTRPAHAGRV